MFSTSYWGGADATTVDEVVERTADAAAAGFECVWFPQTFGLDALTALAVAARQVPNVKIGTAVVPIQGRHPVPLAKQALTVASAAGAGRFTLGIGVTHAPVSEGVYGIPYTGIVEQCAAHLDALVPLVGAARRADVVTDSLTARAAVTADAESPGLLLAALGPRMVQLAGERTDGTITWMTGPRVLEKRIVPALRDAATSASRQNPRVVVGLPVAVTDDPARVRDELRAGMDGAATMNSYRKLVAEEGVDEPVDLAIVGGVDEVTDRLGTLADAGMTEIVIRTAGTPDEVQATVEVAVAAGLADD